MNGRTDDWRSEYPVLVTEAEYRMSVGVIRSLGRAGYPVHACSSEPGALGFRSRFRHAAERCPAYVDPEFLPWLRAYVERHGIRCVIPTEYLLVAIRPAFAEFAPLLPLCGDQERVYRGMSKFDLFEELGRSGAGAHLAPHLLVDEGSGLPAAEAFDELGTPLYIKADGVHARDGADSTQARAPDGRGARSVVADFLERYRRVLVQGHVEGCGVGAFLLRWDERLLAEFMHRRLHEVPPHGVSAYRESWWHPDVLSDARAKLEAIGWSGVAMMEYRWDPRTDAFALLEMNGRFWGSIHLALYAGVDFPALLIDAFHGRTPEPVVGRARDVRSRHTFPLELRYVRARMKDGDVGLARRLWAVPEFFLLGLDPRVRSDLSFPGDRALAWWNFRDYIATVVRKLAGRGGPDAPLR
ncbi:MAG: hypothetical protein GY711_16440 [bacterium]|nr:hypothetical protein [bacterium]